MKKVKIVISKKQDKYELAVTKDVDTENDEFVKARMRWKHAQELYELALVEASVRHLEWSDASSSIESMNDISASAKHIQETRAAFREHLMENADINGSFEEAYFTTGRDEKFSEFRNAISSAIVAHDQAIKANAFEAHTIVEFDRWNIAEKRVSAHWELVEAAMGDIECIANTQAIARFAIAEGISEKPIEVITVAYYAKYPAKDKKSVPSLMTGDIQRETEIVSKITGDKDIAKPVEEYSAHYAEKEAAIPVERIKAIRKEALEENEKDVLDIPPVEVINRPVILDAE